MFSFISRAYDDNGFHSFKPRWRLQQETRQKLRSICTDGDQCKQTSLEAASRREAIRQHFVEFGSGQRSADDVDQHLDLIFEAKKAVLAQNGLLDVIEPHNDGLFGGDLLLNEEQARWIIDQAAKKANNDFDSTFNKQKRKSKTASQRASALALDSFPGNRWPTTTVNYFIGPRFTASQASAIIDGLTMLADGTCLKFVRIYKLMRPVLRFAPIENADPGLYIKKFQDAWQKNQDLIRAVIAHETMHIFGFMHEHTRYDRDDFITVNWTNVDPQALDVFTKDDPEQVNPFCITYNYQSIMHYDSYVGAKDYRYPSFTTKVRPKYHLSRIGNYPSPSRRDILLINKLYCLSDS
uniref:Metalloendopeptidase n=1 Tax=Romanomermis culicivorax TaxID=13658 RepID=A0A915JI42_ROMCU